MKVTPILFTLLAAAGAQASVATIQKNCRVTSVIEQNNPWEEGLGVYSDPTIDDDSETVGLYHPFRSYAELTVGQMHWTDGADGVKITKKELPNKKGVSYEINRGTDAQLVKVIFYSSDRGVVLTRPEDKWLTTATFDCSSTSVIEAAEIKDGTLVTIDELKPIVRKNMAMTDIAYEMGDGYYDLQESKVYRILDAEGVNTEGYLEWARLNYTEGEPVEVIVRYDRNGLRVSSFE